MDSESKKYYCKVVAEFGRVMEDGSQVPKNPTASEWLDLEYGEAVAFQTMVIRPMINELMDDSLEMGVLKAMSDGVMDEKVGHTLLGVIGKGKVVAKR